MDFRDGPAEAAFRGELRTWLAEHLPETLRDRPAHASADDLDALRAWSRALHEAGYVGVSMPAAYGGRGLPAGFDAIVREELAHAGAPEHLGVVGLELVGPALLAHGTETQRDRLLAPILSAAHLWCQGFTVPDGNGDPVGTLTARLERDRLVVEGRSPWLTLQPAADRCLLLARTGGGEAGGDGLTALLVDLTAPGVEVVAGARAGDGGGLGAIEATGLVVPLQDVLGDVGGGAKVAGTALGAARLGRALALVARLGRLLDDAVRLVHDRGATPVQRDVLAGLWSEQQALRLTGLRECAGLSPLGSPAGAGAALLLRAAEAERALTALGLELLGPEAQLLPPNAPYGGLWALAHLGSGGGPLQTGSTALLRRLVVDGIAEQAVS